MSRKCRLGERPQGFRVPFGTRPIILVFISAYMFRAFLQNTDFKEISACSLMLIAVRQKYKNNIKCITRQSTVYCHGISLKMGHQVSISPQPQRGRLILTCMKSLSNSCYTKGQSSLRTHRLYFHIMPFVGLLI